MDMYAMGIAMGAVNTAAIANATQTAEMDAPEVSFAQLLGQVSGGAQQTAEGEEAADVVSGLTWREVQFGMMLGVMKNADRPVPMDPKLAQLMNQLKGLMSQDEESAEGIEQLLAQLKERLKEMAEENGGQMAGMEALALFSGLMEAIPGAMANPAMQELTAQAPEDVMQFVLETEPKEMLSLVTNGQMTLAEDAPAEEAALNQSFEQVMQAETMQQTAEGGTVKAATGGANETQFAQDVVSVEAAPQGEPAEQTPVTQSTSFEDAVREAKQQIELGDTGFAKETAAAEEADENDFEAFQQRVDAGEYLRGTAINQNSFEKPDAVQQVPVTAQLEEGIAAGLAKGTDEFTITLRPAELGEVTIKLNRTENGITMDIIAKNAETQRLLASELNVIKEVLKPMNVEVESVLTQQQDAFFNGQSGFGGQNTRDWDMHGAAYYGDEPLGEAAETTAQPVVAAAPNSALDTYI